MKKIFKLGTTLLAAVAAFGSLQFVGGCSAEVKYEYCADDGGYFIASLSGSTTALDGELIIPETYSDGSNTAPVKKIAQEGFRSSSVTKVQIPASVEELGNAAFANCQHLKSVTFAEGSRIKAIPRGAFGYCPTLSEINIPDSVEEVGVMAFYSCIGLFNLELPESVKVICDQAFESCENLATINLPEGLQTIGEQAFYMAGLTEVVVPDGVTELGRGAFHTCLSLRKAVLGNGIKRITSGAFGYCTALEEITVPASVKAIEGQYVDDNGVFLYGHAFHNCGALKTVRYGGTRADWNAIDIVKIPYENNTITYNNDAIVKDTLEIIYAG